MWKNDEIIFLLKNSQHRAQNDRNDSLIIYYKYLYGEKRF